VNELNIGAQGYSSCSENQSDISRSAGGADTYAGHLTNSQYDYDPYNNASVMQSDLNNRYDIKSSKKSMSSKAYGMEHGNWMGMEASIAD
jgi:hypothetical protein